MARSLFLVVAGFAGALALVVFLPDIGFDAPHVATDAAAMDQSPANEAPARFVTKHAVEIGGETIRYTATAGELFLVEAAGARTGSIFSFAYVKDPIDPSRPVIFVFNGGPGSSSLWLHMGAIGPRRVVLDSEVNPSNVPPFGVADNPHSVLDVADIVFIDPVGTGFSRAVGAGEPEDFWGVDEDANSVARFIELWVTENGRWNSPKFLMGESYGSQRAAVLPRAMMGGPYYAGRMRGITVNGVILLGATLDPIQGAEPTADERAMRSALNLPSYASTAWHHEKIDRSRWTLEDLHEETAAFAQSEYVGALRAGEALGAEDRTGIVDKLAGYTGLPPATFEESLSISRNDFGKRLLADEGLEIGQYDSRYTLPLANSGGDPVADDPAMGRYVPGFIAAFHQMLKEDLEVEIARPYGAIVWEDLLQKWNWERSGVGKGQSFAVDLAWAMRRNQKLRVLVASGYYDLVTTAAAAEHQIMSAGLPEERVTFRNYESGHMLYIGDTAEAFSNDVRELIRSAM